MAVAARAVLTLVTGVEMALRELIVLAGLVEPGDILAAAVQAGLRKVLTARLEAEAGVAVLVAALLDAVTGAAVARAHLITLWVAGEQAAPGF